MARPSGNTDQLLIQAGLALLPQTGCSGLNLRQVAARAGVNLGMFHYHFKTKSVFLKRVLSEVYEEFFRNFTIQVDAQAEPEEKLRSALIALGKMARDRRDFISTMMSDALAGQPEVLEFLQANLHRHVGIIIDLANQCRERQGMARIELPNLIAACVGAIGAPSIALGALEKRGKSKPLGMSMNVFRQSLVSDEAIEARVDWILEGAGLTGRKKRKK